MSLKKIGLWQQDAQEEDDRLFYVREDFPDLLTGKKSLVIGRKGAGKTAIFNYLRNAALDRDYLFQSYEADALDYQKVGEIAGNLAQITAFWKDLIYTTSLTLLDQKYGEPVANSRLARATGLLSQFANYIMQQDFEFEIKGLKISRSPADDWQARAATSMNAVLDITQQLNERPTIMVVFDRLDQGFRSQTDADPSGSYARTVLGLIRACFEIRRELTSAPVSILPVVLLRTDIFDLLKDPDKNRWTDRAVMLRWHNSEIKRLLEFRIARTIGADPEDFPKGWLTIFNRDFVKDSYDGAAKKELFDFIEARTAWRPRDYVYYIRECASYADKAGDERIDFKRVLNTEYNYSTYMRRELIDESGAHIPELDEVLQRLGKVVEQHPTKRFFDAELFKSEFDMNDDSLKKLLQDLYNINILGNRGVAKQGHSDASDHRYAYNTELYRSFNAREGMVIHPAVHRFLRAR